MPHVHFDAHYLTNASSSVAQPFTIVTVVTTTNVPGGSTGSIFVEKNFNVTVNISRANFIAGGFPTVAAGGAGQTLTKAIGTSASVGGLILSYFSGTSSDAEINSTNAWTGGNPGTSAMVNPQMGGSSVFGSTYNWQGEIYELMFFNKNLSTTERSNVTYYLKHKYNLPANNVQ